MLHKTDRAKGGTDIVEVGGVDIINTPRTSSHLSMQCPKQQMDDTLRHGNLQNRYTQSHNHALFVLNTVATQNSETGN